MSEHPYDYAFVDFEPRFRQWQFGQDRAPAIATALHADALAERDAEIAVLRQALAASAADYARLLGQTTRDRRPRPPWRDVPLALAATVWEALVGREREHLGGLLLMLGGIAAVLLAVTFGPGVVR